MNTGTTLPILQYNVRKSRDTVMATLLRDPKTLSYDILAIQEPWRNPFLSTTHSPIKDSFHLCFPRDDGDEPARVCFFVSKRLDHPKWRFTEHTRDLCTLSIETRTNSSEDANLKRLAIHNVYNPCQNIENRRSCQPDLRRVMEAHQDAEQMILGDFNLHHELWGGPAVRHQDYEADDVLDIMEQFNLTLTISPGTATYQSSLGRTTIDLCFVTLDLADRVARCEVDHEMDHDSDHLPITTVLDIGTTHT